MSLLPVLYVTMFGIHKNCILKLRFEVLRVVVRRFRSSGVRCYVVG